MADEDLVACPYDKAHRVRKGRLQIHLVKCAKQHVTNKEIEICPFDSTHRIEKPYLQHHMATCSNRKILDSAKYRLEDDIPHGDLTPTSFVDQGLPPPEEEWLPEETGVVNVPYNPTRKLDTNIISRPLIGGTKAERKAYRTEERRRMQQLMDEKDNSLTNQTKPTTPRLPQTSINISSNMGKGRGISLNSHVVEEVKQTEFEDQTFKQNPERGVGRGNMGRIGINVDELSEEMGKVAIGKGRGRLFLEK